ncbi:hypothetical protein [Stenotrophomonas sp.]|uniref:hypothetical protein n=1 Tax=Stenotrophomonas sp. TaxID=69392 RepID=UPI0033414566
MDPSEPVFSGDDARQATLTQIQVVSATLNKPRKAVFETFYAGSPCETTFSAQISSGGNNTMSDMTGIDTRLRTVEQDVAVIKERLSHMPTTLGMWTALSLVSLAVGSGVVTVLWWAMKSMLEPLLKAAGT